MIFTLLILILFLLDVLFTYVIMRKKAKSKNYMWIEEQNEFVKSCWEKYGLRKGTIIAGLRSFFILAICVLLIEHFPFFKGNIIVSIIKYLLLSCFFILYYSTIFNHLKILSVMRRLKNEN